MRILSIDGGGIRGIIPAMVLAEIERRTARPIASLFDLVAGTSTGGILACGLTAPRARTAAQLVELYRTEGPRIFHRSLWQRVVSAEGLVHTRHEPGPLQEVLREYLGDTRLSEASTRLLATGYDLQGREPYFFKSWRVTEDPGRDLLLRVVAQATAAAPTYFPPVPVHRPGTATRPAAEMAVIDGGVFANNPAMCAYAEAARIAPGEPVRMLSLGAGRQTHEMPYAQAVRWGVVEWARPIIDVVFDGVSDTVDYQLRHLLGDGYDRLEARLVGASDALDDASASNLEALQMVAERLIAAKSAQLDVICEGLLEPDVRPATGDLS